MGFGIIPTTNLWVSCMGFFEAVGVSLALPIQLFGNQKSKKRFYGFCSAVKLGLAERKAGPYLFLSSISSKAMYNNLNLLYMLSMYYMLYIVFDMM